jgi:exodeoxyribonuclease III
MVVVFLYDGRLRFARRSMTRDTSGRNRLFRVISLNANGIRAAARKGFFDWMAKQDADVVCIQETKAQVHQLGDEIFSPSGYHCYYEDAVKKGYSGVAIYSKHKPKKVIRGYGVLQGGAPDRQVPLHGVIYRASAQVATQTQ